MPNMPFTSSVSITVLTFSILGALVLSLVRRWRIHRDMIKGLPQPPSHSILGHLKTMGDIRNELPLDIHPHTYGHYLRTKYDLGDVFYMNLWPVAASIMFISTPDIAHELLNTQKHEEVTEYMAQLTGPKNLVSMHGAEWKTWRAIFNPGFSASHLMTLVPGIVDDSLVFCEILREHAEKDDVFRLEDAATRLTVDIIGKVVLDASFNAQRGENVVLRAMQSQIAWLETEKSLNPLVRFNPIRPLFYWWNTRQSNRFVSKAIHERFRARSSITEKSMSKKKHVIDLALETYFAEERTNVALKNQTIDPIFESYAIDQIRVFLFAGHDTTSSTICYAFHMLSKHPEVMAKVVEEHDDVLGKDISKLPQLLKTEPHLLNKLDYTLAVIKEVLRLFPVASSIRKGDKNLIVRDPNTGAQYPTDGFMVWINHVAFHRNPALWPSPSAFLPSRFLPGSPFAERQKESWRPFERGPRACIGQELAIIEAKVILALTLRSFDVRAAYGEMEKVEGDGKGWPAPVGDETTTVFGEEAYQVWRGTAKPRQGMPARVRMRA